MLKIVDLDGQGRLKLEVSVAMLEEMVKPVARNVYLSSEVLPESLQQTLNQIVAQAGDRKDEVIDALSGEQPAKSRMVESEFVACTWWEGCYYCQDENKNWHRVKCFA